MTEDPFTATLNRFCAGLSEKVAVLAEEPDYEMSRVLVGELLNCIRETIANLLLCELECEWVLGRG